MVYSGEFDGAICPPEGEVVVLSDQSWELTAPASENNNELGAVATKFAEFSKLPGTQDINALYDADGNQIAVLERAMTPEEMGF